MKISFYSWYINHHQLPISNALSKLTGGAYTFISTAPISQHRLQLGYEDMDHKVPYVLTTYDSLPNKKIAEQLVIDSDVVIVGSAPDNIMKRRLPTGKLTFHSSERYFKDDIGIRRKIHNFVSAMKHIRCFQRYPNYYYLCMSAYTASDVNRYADYRGRTFKWGYFPEVKDQNLEELSNNRALNPIPVILWVGRLISWKHPEMAILAAEELKQRNELFQMDFIGNGSMEAELKTMVQEKGLQDCVHFLGTMPPEKVRQHMESADIYLFTSDFNEGWGAVLNESMNSACAIVASHAIGSVPYLLKDGENGLIYKNGDQKQLTEKIVWLLHHPEERKKLGGAAYQTLKEEWNAETAAERFLKLVEHIQSGKPGSPFATGPCSVAENLSNNWYAE